MNRATTTTTSQTRARTQTKSTARRSQQRKRRLPNQNVKRSSPTSQSPLTHPSLTAASRTPAPQPRYAQDSDSDSDYGSRSKKKKKTRLPDDLLRVSSRGVKIPNYVDDVENFEDFEDESYNAQASASKSGYDYGYGETYEEEHEIEGVFFHTRDEERKNDPEDLWHENIVRRVQHVFPLSCTHSPLPIP